MRLLPVRSVLARCAAFGALGTLLTAVVPIGAFAQAQWSPWQAISDGHDNGVDFSAHVGADGYGNNYDHTIHFRFRNRYPETVEIRVAITMATKLHAGDSYTDTEFTVLKPGQIAQDGGAFSVGNHVTHFTMARIQFGYPTARARYEEGRQTCCTADGRTFAEGRAEDAQRATAKPKPADLGDSNPERTGSSTERPIEPHPHNENSDGTHTSGGGVRADARPTDTPVQLAATAAATAAAERSAARDVAAKAQQAQYQAQVAERERQRQAGMASLQAEHQRYEANARASAARDREVAASTSSSTSAAISSVFGAVDGAGAVARDNARADAQRAEEAARIRAAGDASALREHAASLRSDADDAERYAKRADEAADMNKGTPSGGGVVVGILSGLANRMSDDNRSKAEAYRARAKDLRAQADAMEREAASVPAGRRTPALASSSDPSPSALPPHVLRNTNGKLVAEDGYHWVDPTAQNDLRVELNSSAAQGSLPSPARSAEEFLYLARSALSTGDGVTAESYSRQAIGSAPSNELAWLSLITALTREGRATTTIIDTYESALAVTRFAPNIRVAYAQLLDATGHHKHAHKVISDGLTFGESDALRRAEALYAQPRNDARVPSAPISVQASPPPMDRPPTALLDLAATALRAGDAGTAERYSRQAIGSAPANELAWLSLITAITSQGRDTATIIDTYQSALVVAGFAPTIRVAYAKLLNASGRRKDAQKVISEGLALGESDELRRAAASYSAP